MNKALEKSLRDASKEGNLTLGVKQVRGALKDSKLVVVSKSADSAALASGGTDASSIMQEAEKNSIPAVSFEGTSVALGRMCGLQFRTSAVAFSPLAEINVNEIAKEEGHDAKES
ncbi:MAG: ribosomal L7Ae/L30e/S12e/Gadd45 family protein [Nitrosopumilaceae archaeon]|nr:ribosomal L7Ae/L30e/S12e/Gadd45 family protein [Nitrosopumilaceae archaeon]